ncbi:hypothetical protein F5Y15DRAFT_375468 [Xylariaceae sp. FL0016]|nr:hypothetical protein F5Y15DRAFT_375468 [Xylariaceae sp. FL0016]
MSALEVVNAVPSAQDSEGIANDSPDAQQKPPPRKRRRIVISCTECHRRKQKCDRKLPCTNCQSRNKGDSCRYETGTPVAKVDRRASANGTGGDRFHEMPDHPVPPKADFGYHYGGASTLGILRRIEGAGAGEPLAGMPGDHDGYDSFGVRERYKTLIRQLPAKTFIDKLAEIYFHDVNWQYFGVDEPLLRELMDQWYALPFHVLASAGPQALDPMLRAFPALLFQILACALLYLPEGSEETFESLKYTSNMTFDDLAFEYSESGIALMSLLGKRQMSIITVLAGWVRATFLKYTGVVTEAWHQVGTCIRDAQEIGLHKDQADPQPSPDDPAEVVIEKMWMAQHRRMIWQILVGWDLHTGAVLGRPTSVDHRLVDRTPPADVIIPKAPRRVPLVPRGADDPPTPLTRALWSFEIMKPLRDIHDLEKEGPFPKDFSKVEKIHRDILDLQARTPPAFRLHNPDTRFDGLPECWWLRIVRPNLPQILSFNFMALHRPYVFTRFESRREALKASIDMLEAQRQQFAVLQPAQHRTFALFFGTFDAIVMVASIYILFPKEHPELLANTRQHFQWAVERFEKMAERNRLAHAALGVLHAIWVRFKKAVGNGSLTHPCNGAQGNSNGASQASSVAQTPQTGSERSSLQQANLSSNSTLPTPDTENTTPIDPGLTPGRSPSDVLSGAQWQLPADFDFSSLMPMYPMGDIIYNDLTGVSGGPGNGVEAPATAASNWSSDPEAENGLSNGAAGVAGLGIPGLHTMAPGQEDVLPLQFGGEFGNDTIWNLLNQFPS